MNFQDTVNGVVEARHAKVAYPIVGVIVSYDGITHLATVRCTARSGDSFMDYVLPWIVESPGIYNPAPEDETHVIIGFRMGDPESPMIMGRYNPWYKTTIREEAKRKEETVATLTTGRMM
jgi:hypothetical protein